MMAGEGDLISYSQTLPCVFIETQNHDSILSKTEYIKARMHIDIYGNNDYEAVGSEEEPINIEIRGRGNWTWLSYDKKPYKIKLDVGRKLLGMKSNKHWALIAHADDITGFYRNTLGFEISRMMEMDFTSEQRPVEVVINGDYPRFILLNRNHSCGEKSCKY